jgi:hypothetical protein
MGFIPSVHVIPVIPFLSEEHWSGNRKCQKHREQPNERFTAAAINRDLHLHFNWWNNSVHFSIDSF